MGYEDDIIIFVGNYYKMIIFIYKPTDVSIGRKYRDCRYSS